MSDVNYPKGIYRANAVSVAGWENETRGGAIRQSVSVQTSRYDRESRNYEDTKLYFNEDEVGALIDMLIEAKKHLYVRETPI